MSETERENFFNSHSVTCLIYLVTVLILIQHGQSIPVLLCINSSFSKFVKGITLVSVHLVLSTAHMSLGQHFTTTKTYDMVMFSSRRPMSLLLIIASICYLSVSKNTSQQHRLTNVGRRTKCPAVTDGKRGQSPERMTETRCTIITCFVLQPGVTSVSSDIMSHDHSYSMWKPTKSAVLQPSHLWTCTLMQVIRCQFLHQNK